LQLMASRSRSGSIPLRAYYMMAMTLAVGVGAAMVLMALGIS